MFRSMLAVLLVSATAACATNTTAAGAQLGGTDWRLTEIGGRAAEPSDVTRRPWLRFAVDSSRMNGHLGCNRGGSPFTVNGDEIRFGPMMSTRMACIDEAMNRQETALGEALQKTDRFRVSGDVLELLQGSAVLAKFARTP